VGVGAMRDKKLKLRDLCTSHPLSIYFQVNTF